MGRASRLSCLCLSVCLSVLSGMDIRSFPELPGRGTGLSGGWGEKGISWPQLRPDVIIINNNNNNNNNNNEIRFPAPSPACSWMTHPLLQNQTAVNQLPRDLERYIPSPCQVFPGSLATGAHCLPGCRQGWESHLYSHGLIPAESVLAWSAAVD